MDFSKRSNLLNVLHLFLWLPTEWKNAFDKRREAPAYRVQFIRYTMLGAAFITTIVVLFLNTTQIRTLLPLGASASATYGYLQMRAWHKRRYGNDSSGVKIGKIVTFSILAWMITLWVASFIPNLNKLITMLAGWTVLFLIYRRLIRCPIWMIEIKRGEIFYHSPYFTPEDDILFVGRPAPEIKEDLLHAIRKAGISRSTLKTYLNYGAPDYMEAALKRELSKEAVREANDTDSNLLETLPIEASVEEIAQELNKGFLSKHDKSEIPEENLQLLSRFIQACKNARRPPVFWIHPPDEFGIFWDQSDYIWLQRRVDHLHTNRGIPFGVEIRLALLPDPREITAPNFRNMMLRNPSLQQIQNILLAAFGYALDNFTENYFSRKPFHEAFSAESLRIFSNKLADEALAEIEVATGVEIQGWSIDCRPIIDRIYTDAIMDEVLSEFTAEAGSKELRKVLELFKALGVPPELQAEFIFKSELLKKMPRVRGGIPASAVNPSQLILSAPAPKELPPPEQPANKPSKGGHKKKREDDVVTLEPGEDGVYRTPSENKKIDKDWF